MYFSAAIFVRSGAGGREAWAIGGLAIDCRLQRRSAENRMIMRRGKENKTMICKSSPTIYGRMEVLDVPPAF